MSTRQFVDINDRENQKTTYFLDRSRKRTRELERGDVKKQSIEAPFVKLLDGQEPSENMRIRWTAYERAWTEQEKRIYRILAEYRTRTMAEFNRLLTAPWNPDVDTRIPAALFLPGSNIANHIRLFSDIRDEIARKREDLAIYHTTLHSKESPNLKTVLKIIVGQICGSGKHNAKGAELEGVEVEAQDEDEEDDIGYDGRIRYDLDILVEWCRRQAESKNLKMENIRVVVSLEDTDSFDFQVVYGMIRMLQSYNSQVPLIVVFSVGTSLDMFQDRLPRSAMRLMSCSILDARFSRGYLDILNATVFSSTNPYALHMGPQSLLALVQRQKSSMESIDTFISSLKYCYMAFFFANPFSIFLYGGLSALQITLKRNRHYMEAARLLPSFRQHVDRKMADGTMDKREATQLLQDDNELSLQLMETISAFRLRTSGLLTLLDFLDEMHATDSQPHLSKLDWYSAIVNAGTNDDFKHMVGGLASLRDKKAQAVLQKYAGPLHDWLSLFTPSPSARLLEAIIRLFKDKRATRDTLDKLYLTSSGDSFLEEILVLECPQLLSSALSPDYRPSMEYALANPLRYLRPFDFGQDIKLFEEPHLAVLYGMYRESSVFINLHDYYVAFRQIVERGNTPTDPEWNERVMGWFLSGVAELKLLGIVRDCKRKFECIEKIAWRGL